MSLWWTVPKGINKGSVAEINMLIGGNREKYGPNACITRMELVSEVAANFLLCWKTPQWEQDGLVKFSKDTYCKTGGKENWGGEGNWGGERETPVPTKLCHKAIKIIKKKRKKKALRFGTH